MGIKADEELVQKMLEMSLLERLEFCVLVIMTTMSEMNAKEFEAHTEDKKTKVVMRLEESCRVCGCTWNTPCDGGCWWVEDNLCSSCGLHSY